MFGLVLLDSQQGQQECRAQSWRETQLGAKPSKTIEQVMIEYPDHADRLRKSYDTMRDRVKTVRTFFAGRMMNDLSGKDIREYSSPRLKEGKSPATLNRELAALSAAINWWVTELEWHLPNPMKGRTMKEPEGLGSPEPKQSRLAGWPRGFAGGLHSACSKHWLPEGGDNEPGMAASRFGQRLFHLEGVNTKASKRRSIPLNEGVMAALKSRMAARSVYAPTHPGYLPGVTGKRD